MNAWESCYILQKGPPPRWLWATHFKKPGIRASLRDEHLASIWRCLAKENPSFQTIISFTGWQLVQWGKALVISGLNLLILLNTGSGFALFVLFLMTVPVHICIPWDGSWYKITSSGSLVATSYLNQILFCKFSIILQRFLYLYKVM